MWIPSVKDIEQLVDKPDKLLSVKETATVAEAAAKMNDNRIGCLVVFDANDQFCGVLSERDMLAKVTTSYVPPQNILVAEIMTPNPISCTSEMTLDEVEQIMAERQIRHLPILEDGRPVGMVSTRDIIAFQLHNNKAMKAAAEQLALLSTELKSLNLKEVIALAIEEVPRSLEADSVVLCFAQQDSSGQVIYRRDCALSRKELLSPEKMSQIPKDGSIITTNPCAQCSKGGGDARKLIIPLMVHDQAEGIDSDDPNAKSFLCMCRFNPVAAATEKLLLYKASLLQEILSINLTNAKLYQNYQKARQDSEVDPLTGVGTRRVLEHVLRAEYARALRYNRTFSIGIVDLDNFKNINDTAGHEAGDKALKQLAKIMLENVRMTDIIITRFGGDEFVLLMPETDVNGATILLERLRRQAKTISIRKAGSITTSSGAAEWSGSPEETAEIVLQRADAALYEAKNAGRNCVVKSQANFRHELAAD